jgi:NADPH2:quinone reductase
MKAWRFHTFGDLSNLQLEDVPQPAAGDGEAVVQLQYAALNPADAFLVRGLYPGAGEPPFAPGRDGSGVIADAAPGGRFQQGDRVVVLRSDLGVTRDGTFAEYVRAPESTLAPLPDGWSMEEGAAGPLVLLTAWRALMRVGGLEPGERVLVTGASGGVGTAAVMLAKARGARVVALSRSPVKRERLTELGADAAIPSDAQDLGDLVRGALDGGRVDLTVENLGGPFLDQAVALSAPRGRIMVVGLLAGLKAEVTIGRLIHKQVRIEGVSVGAYTDAEAQEDWLQIVAAMERSGMRPLVDETFAMGDLPSAFEHLEANHMGKVLLKTGE